MTNSADPDHWLLKKPIDLDLHCLQRQGIFGFSKKELKYLESIKNIHNTSCFVSLLFYTCSLKSFYEAVKILIFLCGVSRLFDRCCVQKKLTC